MPRSRLRLLILLLVTIGLSSTAYSEESTMKVGRFGNVNIYRPATEPKHVVLFISGDGGWNLGVVEMARELQKLDTLVVGIDINRYLQTLALPQRPQRLDAVDEVAMADDHQVGSVCRLAPTRWLMGAEGSDWLRLLRAEG